MKKLLLSGKVFVYNMLNGNSDTSHKRFISLLSFFVLVVMTIVSFFNLPVNENLAYIFAGLVLGQSALTIAEKHTNKPDQQ